MPMNKGDMPIYAIDLEQGTLWQSHRSPDQTETMVIESIHRFTKSKENRVSVASFHKNGKGGWAIHYRATLRIGRAITLSLLCLKSPLHRVRLKSLFLPSAYPSLPLGVPQLLCMIHMKQSDADYSAS